MRSCILATLSLASCILAVSRKAHRTKTGPRAPRNISDQHIEQIFNKDDPRDAADLMSDITRPTPRLAWRQPRPDGLDIAQICAKGGLTDRPRHIHGDGYSRLLGPRPAEVMKHLLDHDPNLAWGNVPRDKSVCDTPPFMVALEYARPDVVSTMLKHPSAPKYIPDTLPELPPYLSSKYEVFDGGEVHVHTGLKHRNWYIFDEPPYHTYSGLLATGKKVALSSVENILELHELEDTILDARDNCNRHLIRWRARDSINQQWWLEHLLRTKCRLDTTEAREMARDLIYKDPEYCI